MPRTVNITLTWQMGIKVEDGIQVTHQLTITSAFPVSSMSDVCRTLGYKRKHVGLGSDKIGITILILQIGMVI